ncbi:MAG TPA: phosphatidylglycerophosphatase A [Vicinamibacterales bacterium]|nr:phosphatidylglycerophosphatase A [Vicinamibacterales bacterium]
MTRLAVVIATAGGAGLAPAAPGTAGSAVGVLIYLLTADWPILWQGALLIAITVAGVWASNVAERHFQREDPGAVVIDEVAGQLLTCLATAVTWRGALVAFVLFRLFDIIKPWPTRRFESLPGGLGIMADDLMAGVYGNLALRATLVLIPAVA